MSEAYVVSIGRSAITRAGKNGSLLTQNPVSVAGKVLKEVVGKIPELDPKEIEDVIVGCAFPEAEQGMNIGRLIAQAAGLPDEVSGQTVNRFCASGLQSIASAANAIMSNQMDVVVAGGLEFMSAIPMGGSLLVPVPELMIDRPDNYIQMGVTAENIAEKYGITRTEQDEFAVNSHKKLYAAQEKGVFEEEIIPLAVGGAPFSNDEGVRPNSSLETLGKLRTVFKMNGTVTAGNSSQISDGTAFVVLMSKEKVEELQLQPIAKFSSFAVSGLDPAFMGLGPIKAIPKAVEKAGLTMEEIDLVELNEAFASQAIACMRELDLPAEKVNVNGGAIAHGHPLGATGSLLTVKLLSEMKRRKNKYGVVSMCIGGGMGAAGVYELL